MQQGCISSHNTPFELANFVKRRCLKSIWALTLLIWFSKRRSDQKREKDQRQKSRCSFRRMPGVFQSSGTSVKENNVFGADFDSYILFKLPITTWIGSNCTFLRRFCVAYSLSETCCCVLNSLRNKFKVPGTQFEGPESENGKFACDKYASAPKRT